MPAAGSGPDSPASIIADVLAVVRRTLGLGAAVVSRVDGGLWRASHVDDAVFGLAPGDELPLESTY